MKKDHEVLSACAGLLIIFGPAALLALAQASEAFGLVVTSIYLASIGLGIVLKFIRSRRQSPIVLLNLGQPKLLPPGPAAIAILSSLRQPKLKKAA